MEYLQTIAVALLGGGFVSFIEFLIRRKDEKADRHSEIMDAIQKLEARVESIDQKSDERNAVTARVRILKFCDEMLEGRRHTKDSFQQVLRDIDEYEDYCGQHPEFKNNQTISTINYIKNSYRERLEKHDFL